ncbi:MAG TPA: aldolase/citrate lyase family protein [Bryobacteraceae bacterium]|nr:aldolase/citrate lyase family protein [Bryobacteraceae bacterium]
MTEKFLLTAITADPHFIRAADDAGVDRIGIDVERLGKSRRQGHIAGARISEQRMEELATVTAHARQAEVFVRINPVNDESEREIDHAISLGAHVVMLPQFHSVWEVERFVSLLDGRATAVLLLETTGALECVANIVRIDGVSEVMVGLNDLHLALGMSNHFDVVVSDAMRRIADVVRDAGLRFGFGGVARPGDDSLPVAPDLVLAQYGRLSATSAWLSRSFFRGLRPEDMADAVQSVRRRLTMWQAQPESVLDAERARLTARLRLLASAVA